MKKFEILSASERQREREKDSCGGGAGDNCGITAHKCHKMKTDTATEMFCKCKIIIVNKCKIIIVELLHINVTR